MLPAFLPSGYEAPKTQFYMKMKEGENKFRILSTPVLGWEDWDNKKPIRFRYDQKPANSIDPAKPMKHFWAMIVWNYKEECIQILQVTQASIRNTIEHLCHDEDWGSPYTYDIKVTKKGEGMNTEYVVNPLPHKPLSEAIKKAFRDRPCNLEALFENADPFGKWDTFTPLAIDSHSIEQAVSKVPHDDILKLEAVLSECDPAYVDSLFDTLREDPFNIQELKNVTPSIYARLMTAALKKREEFQAAKAG